MALLQEVEIAAGLMTLKFSRTVKVSSITNNRFVIDGMTDPFETIDLARDYSTISRTLALRWGFGKFEDNTEYELTVTGLKDSSGATIPDETITFTTGSVVDDTDSDNIPDLVDDVDDEPGIPLPELVVHDFSIKSGELSDITIIPGGTAGNFYVKSTDPNNGEYYIDNDYNNGRVAIKFNKDPQAQFINSTYFKAQRKPIQRTPVRWETLPAIVSKHSNRPYVFVDFPSLDSTPVYTTLGTDYFEENYKYRVIVSSEVGAE